MLHASALAVGWKSALLALLPHRRNDAGDTAVSNMDTRQAAEVDDEREPFHLDDTEITLRLVKSRGLQEYKTPPHAHLMFPPKPVR
jgi:hypothetical protein